MYFLNVPSVSIPYFQQNKTNVSVREIAQLVARNPCIHSHCKIFFCRKMLNRAMKVLMIFAMVQGKTDRGNISSIL